MKNTRIKIKKSVNRSLSTDYKTHEEQSCVILYNITKG